MPLLENHLRGPSIDTTALETETYGPHDERWFNFRQSENVEDHRQREPVPTPTLEEGGMEGYDDVSWYKRKNQEAINRLNPFNPIPDRPVDPEVEAAMDKLLSNLQMDALERKAAWWAQGDIFKGDLWPWELPVPGMNEDENKNWRNNINSMLMFSGQFDSVVNTSEEENLANPAVSSGPIINDATDIHNVNREGKGDRVPSEDVNRENKTAREDREPMLNEMSVGPFKLITRLVEHLSDPSKGSLTQDEMIMYANELTGLDTLVRGLRSVLGHSDEPRPSLKPRNNKRELQA